MQIDALQDTDAARGVCALQKSVIDVPIIIILLCYGTTCRCSTEKSTKQNSVHELSV